MTTHPEDFRVTRAREFLASNTDDLPLARRLLGWLLDVADDYAETELDAEVSQATLWGGVYLAPADVHHLPAEFTESLPASALPTSDASSGSRANPAFSAQLDGTGCYRAARRVTDRPRGVRTAAAERTPRA